MGVAATAPGVPMRDVVETEPAVVRALLRVENMTLPGVIWEPASGPGAIARVLRASGREVFATDIVDYASPDQDLGGIDFLTLELPPRERGGRCDCIVTNPPFSLAAPFVVHALTLCRHVVMLLPWGFYTAQRASALLPDGRHILDGGMLVRVWCFSNRPRNMHRLGWTGPKASPMHRLAWFVWDREARAVTTVRRIRIEYPE